MDRSDKKNALTMAIYEPTAVAIETAGGGDATRCLIMAGAPTVFYAGNDIGSSLKGAAAAEASARR